MSNQPRVLVPLGSLGAGEVTLPPDESRHALKVLRVAPPDVITVTDGAGTVARCAASRVEGGSLIAEILESELRRPLLPEVVVYQGAAKGGKVDDVVERLAEMGVAETTVFASERSVVRWDQAKAARLAERWGAIARSTAKQSRSPFVMRTDQPLSWERMLARVANEQATVVLWEGASLPLRTALHGPPDRIALVVGPEGGFAREEAEALADAGGQLVSLGPRILRTENAPIVSVAAVLYHYGLIG
jgi:16S rRNA (uracil1498-N3)-methyltransferase